MPKKKKPVIRDTPNPKKTPVIPDQMESDGWRQTPVWSFSKFDPEINLPKGDINSCSFCEIAGHLRAYEGMAWKDIIAKEDRNHYVDIDKFQKFAVDRLRVLGMDEYESIFRFRLTGKNRLWGVKEGRVFLVLWWDPEHEICLSHK